MPDSTIRIGVIGAGNNTRSKHLPNLQQVEGVEVAAVCNRRPESSAAVASDFDIPKVCKHWREVIELPEVDAVLIGTWPYLHGEAACAAFDAGKHVLCEARMAMNAAEAHRMFEKQSETGLVGQIVPSPVGLKVHNVVNELIEAGHLGELYEVSVRALNARYLDPETPLHWRQDERLSGLNVLALGILNETVQRWLGDTISVQASTRTFIPERLDEAAGERRRLKIPDSVVVMADMACGARAVYHLSGVAYQGGEPRIEMYGSEGTLCYLAGLNLLLGAKRSDPELEEIAVPEEKVRGWTVESDFIRSIREGAPVELTSFEDGVKYMEFTEAVWQSARTGLGVPLPLGTGG